MGSFPYPRNGIVKFDYEFILLFKKPGKAPTPTTKQKKEAKLTNEEWNTYFYGHWNFSGARQQDHIAVFPEELPRRLIKMFTFGGETVLDPFLGSGTTLKVADELNRSAIGYETNESYLPVIQLKVGGEEQRDLFSPDINLLVHVDRIERSRKKKAIKKESLNRLDNRDPGGYGSVIRKGDPGREEYHRVKEIRDIRTLVLDNGEVICLVGIVPNSKSSKEGLARLHALVNSRQVYYREDAQEASEDKSSKEREVYLYLKNKTFVNARLVREGLADADRSKEYRHRSRFERYSGELEKN